MEFVADDRKAIAYWQELQFQIQENAPQDWVRIVDTASPSPEDFPEPCVPLQQFDIPGRRAIHGFGLS